jgi:gliding motility-associated-like protein
MTDSIGCTNIFNDSIVISAGIYVPNVFSPNGDTHNDVFYINYNGLDIISFKVFTRTGILIYKTEAKTIAWDGRLPSGDKVLPGIYFYVVETVNTTTPVKKSGFFYIFQ